MPRLVGAPIRAQVVHVVLPGKVYAERWFVVALNLPAAIIVEALHQCLHVVLLQKVHVDLMTIAQIAVAILQVAVVALVRAAAIPVEVVAHRALAVVVADQAEVVVAVAEDRLSIHFKTE